MSQPPKRRDHFLAVVPDMQQVAALTEPISTPFAARRHEFTKYGVGPAERRALLLLGDLLAINGALAVTATLVPKPAWLVTEPGVTVAPHWFALLSLVWIVLAMVADSYDLSLAGQRFASPFRVAWVGALVVAVYSLVPFVTPVFLKSRLMWLALVLCAAVPLAAWRLLYASVIGHPVLERRALIVGSGDSGRIIVDAIHQRPGSGYRALGFVAVDAAEARTATDLPIVGTASDLARLLEMVGADEVVVAASGPMPAEALRAITAAYESGIRVTRMTQLYEELMGRIPVEHVGDHWLTVLPQANSASASYALIKRLTDVVGAGLGLVVAGLLCLPISVAIVLDTGWPILFVQERLGQRGHAFRIYKFRTVSPQRPHDGRSIWERKATRPTRVGRYLRRVRLDELPQFWNVLKGDMSLVGPRPFVPEEVEELQQRIPFFRSRLLVRPGLTGWAQVNGGYGTTLDDELVKLQYDLYYIRHQSVALDLLTLLKTIAVVLRLAGR